MRIEWSSAVQSLRTMRYRGGYGRIENTRELVFHSCRISSCTRFPKSAWLCSICCRERSDGRSHEPGDFAFSRWRRSDALAAVKQLVRAAGSGTGNWLAKREAEELLAAPLQGPGRGSATAPSSPC